MQRGRGRGESPKIARLEEDEPSRRLARAGASGSTLGALGEAPEPTSSSSEGEAEKTIRGRGGFRAAELHLIPEGISVVKAEPANCRQVDLLSNFIKITPMPNRHVFQYRVDFEPNIESTKLRGKLFGEHVRPKFTDQMVIFDGMSDARSGHGSHQELTVVADHPSQENTRVTITVKRVGKVDNQFEQIRLYNMLMKKYLIALGFFRVSNTGAYVHPELKTPVGDELITIRGYRTSANVHEGGAILMNLESVHKLMQRKNVLELLASMRNQPNFIAQANTGLSGKLVVTNYNKQVYRIEEVIFNKSPADTFHDEKAGKDVSFVEYNKTRWGIDVRDKAQPLLRCVLNNVRQGESAEGKEVLLVPELCNIAGLTDSQRMDGRLKRPLIESSQINPQERVHHLQTFMGKLHSDTTVKESLSKWGYSYDTMPVTIKARVLNTECIQLGKFVGRPSNEWPKVDDVSGGFERAVMSEKLAKPATFTKLYIIISRTDASKEGFIVNKLRSGFERVGCMPNGVDFLRITEGDSPQLFVQYLKRVPNDATAALIILPRQNKERYDAVKKFASVERGLITQVVTASLMTDDRKASGAAVKIGIQVAAKIGGEPWFINLPLPKAMVCGYDTYHDTANRGRSFGAFVASMNGTFSRWFSKADSHDRLDELSAHLADNFGLALRRYKTLNGYYPERVIIYRDGVSDGQLEHVLNSELKAVRNVLKNIQRETGDSGKIRLTYTVVNKRIGARFYLRAGDGKFKNPPPGTVVDDRVTRKERYDFYLVSQSTTKGTVAPTYYSILFDESGLDPAKHQMLAFKMCFLYYNWTGTVRVPAPCQYAHKLALLCGEHLHAVPNSVLDDRLHFL